jgi:V8-like Glu-specific endopeptidase
VKCRPDIGAVPREVATVEELRMSSILANRQVVGERFPVLGFTVRTGLRPSWFEVALAADPELFAPEAKARRTSANFYSSREAGPLPAMQGEAVYLVPAEVLARFAGHPRLYYRLAVSAQADLSNPQIASLPPDATPYVTVSKTYTGRTRRQQITGRPNGSRRNGYGSGTAQSLTWAGDAPAAGQSEPVKAATIHPAANPAAPTEAPKANGTARAAEFEYDDSFDPALWAEPEEAVDGDDHGIEGPIPDGAPQVMSRGLGEDAPKPEYEQASRFVAAAEGNYSKSTGPRTIRRVVIHITDGGRAINGTVGWFQNPAAKVSAHYIVGQDGEVVQMVRENDVAWHASGANGNSIGIEHVANTRGLKPTEAEYCASAALVRYLCEKYGLAMEHVDADHWGPDVTGIQGHSEADPKTGHKGCPNAAWDWDYFMQLVQQGQCFPRATASALGEVRKRKNGNKRSGAQPLTVVEPISTPSDPQAALRFMKDFQDRMQKWKAGVGNTSVFPHSAICQFQITLNDGSQALGTGFYIARDRILTCAHNVDGAASLKIIPGKNDDQEPFGSFTVSSSDWDVHPRYQSDSRDFDLAVIRVGTPPPNGAAFDQLEELLQSLPSPIIVCGYAADTVNQDKQHLDGDTIREVKDNTFQNNLQTEPGNSGSPVFYVWGREDEETQTSVLETRLVGVHVSGFSKTLNQGCRLTEDKIKWIRSVGKPYSAGAALGVEARRRDDKRPRKPTDREQAGPAVVEIASAVAGAAMTRILDNEGDVKWELDQLRGLKHVGDNPANAGNGVFKTITTPVDGYWVENLLRDRIEADFEIRWQANGHSLGNVELTNTKTNDAVGWGLEVKGTIMDDAAAYVRPPSADKLAALKVRFYYRFTRGIGSDQIAIQDITLYSDGTHDETGRWTQE